MRRWTWRTLSLRVRLTVLAAIAVAVAVAVVSLTSWLLVRAKLYQDFDDQLRSYAQLSTNAPSPAAALAGLATADRGAPGALTVQFLDDTGRVTGTSGGAGPIPVTARARQVAAGDTAVDSDVVRIGHDRYRVWTAARPGGAVQVARDSEGVEDTLAVLGLWHGLIGLVGVIGAAVVGALVARAALRPVDALTAAATDIARTQDLGTGLPESGRGEIGRLAEAFNAMLAALARSRDDQRRLVEDAGHELRTPLTSLRNNIELLIHADAERDPAKVLSETDRARLLADLDTQTGELSTLVAELIDLSTGDRRHEAVERVDLADVVGATVERARSRAPHVRFVTEAAAVEVAGRPAELARAVLNLLDNAAKWSPPDGTVTVRVEVAEDAGIARVVVTDEGAGIAPADLPHVFERFYRAETARSMPGSGLGLAIVAQVAADHGGSAAAGNTDAGGAWVSITLPLDS